MSNAQTAGELDFDKDLPSPEATQRLIKSRRSCFPKDYTGESFDRYHRFSALPCHLSATVHVRVANLAPSEAVLGVCQHEPHLTPDNG